MAHAWPQSSVTPPAADAQTDPDTSPPGTAFNASAFVQQTEDGTSALDLVIENLHFPACVQKIERGLNACDAVLKARVNLRTHRLRVLWDVKRMRADAIIQLLSRLGYRAKPFDPRLESASGPAPERALLRAIGVTGFSAANVMLISVSVWAGLVEDMGPATRDFFHWLSALIVLPAIAYAGRPFFSSAGRALAARSLNMDVPISLAVIAAAGMSLWETITGGAYVYFDAAVMLLFFLLIGRYLDMRVRSKARAAAHNLLALGTTSATLMDETGRHQLIPVENLTRGMTLFIAAGEHFPADGVIMSGVSEVDASMMTGESLPQAVKKGAEVFAGTVNVSAPVSLRVTVAGEHTVLSQIVRLMDAAEQTRAKYARLADRAARIYAPAVHVLAALTFLGWLVIAHASWQAALINAIAVLIITCPCALGLAVPAVQVVAVGRLLKKGVLAKAPDALERLATIDAVVFDKTGTLTRGAPTLINAATIGKEDLALAASLAGASRHPLSQALRRAAGSAIPPVPDVTEHPGQGLVALIEGQEIRLGNRAWCAVEEHTTAQMTAASELWLRAPGRAPVRFAFRDQIRPDAARVVRFFRARGFFVGILSGDREEVVSPLAQSIGIEHWRSNMRPGDKIAALQKLKAAGRRVLMVGDGMNDAPALAAADVSLSPSTASDIAQARADFIFQGERLMPVVELYRVAQQARRLILQNFGFALSYNLLAVPLAMAGLITPIIAALAMSASSLLVTTNALRLHVMKSGEAP